MKKKNKNGHNLKQRFFLSFTGIFAIIMLLTFSIFSIYVYRSNLERSKGFISNLTELSANQLDTLIQDMDNEALQIIANPTTLEAFDEAGDYLSPSNYFDTNIILRNELVSNLAAINGPNMYSNRINVYNNLGDYVSIGIYQESREAVLSELTSADFHKRYNDILLLNGDSTVYAPSPDKWGGKTDRILFSVVREIRDVYHSYGIVEIQHEYSSIDDIFSSYNRPDGIDVYVLSTHELIYPYTSNKESTQGLLNHFSKIIRNNDTMVKEKNPITGIDEFISYAHLENANWTVVYTQSVTSLSKDFTITALISLIATLLIAGVAAILIYVVSNRLTKPIRLLTKNINEINIANPSISIAPQDSSLYEDEFDALNQSFSNLFHKLENSKNEVIQLKTSEMHAQILALQSQMNPHFLYNTLSVINASAIEENYEKTSELCTMLSSMLRYSSSFEDEMVTLIDELNHACSYLKLMKERFEDGLTYSINCDPELEHLLIPKIILQPLIENSFNHGFKNKRPPWKIEINVLRIKDYWVLEITDNGTGFDADRLRELNEKMNKYFSNPSVSITSLKFGGLALLNILIRIKYIYKEKMIFNVINLENNSGTTIQLGGPVYDQNHVN